MKTLGKLAMAGLVAGGLAFAATAPAEAQHVTVGVGVPAYGPGYYGSNPCYSPYADPYYCSGYPAYYDDYGDYDDYGYPGFVGFGFGFGHGFHGHGGHGFHGGHAGFHGGFHGGSHGGHR